MLKEIARNDWAGFFESFTLQHGHSLVHVDGEKESLPLAGITSRDGRIVIHLGADIQHHRIITIDGAHVRVAQDGGVEGGMEIESTDGHVTRLAFSGG